MLSPSEHPTSYPQSIYVLATKYSNLIHPPLHTPPPPSVIENQSERCSNMGDIPHVMNKPPHIGESVKKGRTAFKPQHAKNIHHA